MGVISREVVIFEARGADAVIRAYRDLEAAERGSTRAGKDAARAQRDQAKAADEVRTGLGRVVQAAKEMRGAAGELRVFGLSLTEINSGAELAIKALKGLRKAAQIAAEPVDLAISFERQFNLIRTLSRDVTDDLKQEMLALAAELPQTAADIASAGYQAISGGIRPDEVIGFLRNAANTAIAGNATLTDTIQSLVTATTAFKEQGLSTEAAAQQLFNTVVRGRTDLTELATAMGRSAPQAAQFGVSFAEINAAVAQFTKAGNSTAESFTLVNAAIKAIGKGKKELAAIGVEGGAAALQAKGLAGVMREILVATGGNVDAIQGLTGRWEGVSALLGILKGDMAGYLEDLQFIRDETGFLGRATRILGGDTQAAINRFNALKEGVLRDLGNQVLPAVNHALEVLTERLGQDGPKIAEALADILVGVVELGVWVIENSSAIATGLATAAGAATGFGVAFLAATAPIAGVAAGVVAAMGAMAFATDSLIGDETSGLTGLSGTLRESTTPEVRELIDEMVEAEFRATLLGKSLTRVQEAFAKERAAGLRRQQERDQERAKRAAAEREALAAEARFNVGPDAGGKKPKGKRGKPRETDFERGLREVAEEDKRLAQIEAIRERFRQRDLAAQLKAANEFEKVGRLMREAEVERLRVQAADADRFAELNPNSLEAQQAALDAQRDIEVDAARERGENVLYVEELFLQRREEAARAHAERVRQAYVQGFEDVLATGTSLVSALSALGGQVGGLEKLLAVGRAALAWADAISFTADGLASTASFNFFSATKFAAAAAGKVAAAAAYTKVAGGGAGGAPSVSAGGGAGAGVGGGAGAPQADRPGRFQAPAASRGDLNITLNQNFSGQPFETRHDIHDAAAMGINSANRRAGGARLEVA